MIKPLASAIRADSQPERQTEQGAALSRRRVDSRPEQQAAAAVLAQLTCVEL